MQQEVLITVTLDFPMHSRRFVAATLTLLVATTFLISCSKKPVFVDPTIVIDHPPMSAKSASSLSSSTASTSASTPPSLLINVPFAPQAPFANWDALHEEACEEMSLIMVHHYLNDTPLNMSGAETEVQSLVAWETAHNYEPDVNMAQLGDIAQSLYGVHARVLSDVTAQILRNELAKGNPIIVPAAGRALKNPYFSGAGPFYHVLVVVGYTSDGFITNDPGTKQGKKYWYATDVLMNALHDWTGVKEEIATGAKMALVVEK